MKFQKSFYEKALHGGQLNPTFVERLTLTIRQPVAAVGRRVRTLWKGEAGWRQQLALYSVYSNHDLEGYKPNFGYPKKFVL